VHRFVPRDRLEAHDDLAAAEGLSFRRAQPLEVVLPGRDEQEAARAQGACELLDPRVVHRQVGYRRVVTEAVVDVRGVKQVPTRSGNTRFVLVDAEGREFTTFREEIASRLEGLEGKRARIQYHEEQRGKFTNVYLDRVEPLPEEADGEPGDYAAEEAWRMAIEAAPYLLSGDAVAKETSADELFEKLKPFQQLVEDDLEHSDDNGD
jgi:hypothetical protein